MLLYIIYSLLELSNIGSLMEYFVEKNGKPVGPYDLMSMIRKVRNKAINTEDKVIVGAGGEAKPAFEIAELREIFDESERFISVEPLKNDGITTLKFDELMGKGLEFFKNHANLSLITGVFLLIVVFGNYLLNSVFSSLLFVVFSSIWNCFAFSVFQIIILRKTRMQLASSHYIIKTVKRYSLQLLIYSAIVGLAILIIPLSVTSLSGSPYPLLLILFPGSLLMMAFFYVPILIVDQGVPALQAFGQSLSFLKRMGGENSALLYTFLLANFIAATLLVLPILITLPITFGILSEMYDEHYNQS